MSHDVEPHSGALNKRLNALRASVLGANDGIVSIASLVVGVAGATSETQPVLLAGVAGLVGGAVSMALGEYVSVSSQRDSERDLVAKESAELRDYPEEEMEELVGLYVGRGLSTPTATLVAKELTEHDALRAHLDAELGIDPDDVASPLVAAFSSAAAFTVGGLLPMLAIVSSPVVWRVWITMAVVLAALAITGGVAAKVGGGHVGRAATRLVVGGALALGLTYAIGSLVGTTM